MNRLCKVIKKGISIFTVISFTVGCIFTTGCDGVYMNQKETVADEVKKPEKITVMCSGSAFKGDDAKAFEAYLESLLSSKEEGIIELDIITPEDSRYYDMYSSSSSWTIPDVMLLGEYEYTLFAASGMLWNMTEAWENSKTKNSGRLIDDAQSIISSLYVNDDMGNKGLYGMPANRGNGCITYVKADWLERAGIDRSSVEGKTLTFEQYYNMLKNLKATSGSDYVLAPPGLVADDAPYTHYLPEFYQDAQFTFYKDEKGEYVDGFTQPAMIEAIKRIKTAIADGVIDGRGKALKTSEARDCFCSTDPKEESGVFTYWSGKQVYELKKRLKGAVRADGSVMSDELIAIKPIEELGQYVERTAPVWCILKECENPEGVFEYFIDTMLDGGDIQMAWQYGVKDQHWDEDTDEFTTNYFYPNLVIAPADNDPGMDKMPVFVKESTEFYTANSRHYEIVPVTEELGTYSADIKKKRKEIIYKVVMDPYYSPEQGIKDYNAAVGQLVNEVLKSLNKLEKKK